MGKRTVCFVILLGQCMLIGLAAHTLTQHPSPAGQVCMFAVIGANIVFGAVNVRTLLR